MIALIDYNMGNLFSVSKAFEFCGEKVEIISKPEELDKFDAAVLPGVGNFGDGMEHLNSFNFINPVKAFAASGRPLLGICMGMQMLLESSDEAPGVAGMGLIKGRVCKFPQEGEKVPQMGWNQVGYPLHSCSRLFRNIPDGSFFYFVHSFYAKTANESDTLGVTDYILNYASSIGRGNIFGVQFHPEKSQNCGLELLKNFIGIVNDGR